MFVLLSQKGYAFRQVKKTTTEATNKNLRLHFDKQSLQYLYDTNIVTTAPSHLGPLEASLSVKFNGRHSLII